MATIGFAAIHHRTNAFALRPSSLLPGRTRLWASETDIDTAFRGTQTVAGAFLAAAQRLRFRAVPLLACYALAGGPVPHEELEDTLGRLEHLLRRTQPRLDALLLHLSGTMTTADGADADARVLRRLRAVLGDTFPIVTVFDHVANLTPETCGLCSLVIGPHDWPGADLPRRVEETIDRLLPVLDRMPGALTAVERLPMMLPLSAHHTGSLPLQEIAFRLREAEIRPGVLAATLFGGFPYADAPHVGAAVAVAGLASRAVLEETAKELAWVVWEQRDHLVEAGLNIEQAVHSAMAGADRAVIADTGDATEAGAPGEGTTALWALLDLGARGATLAIVDPEAAEAAATAGPGSDFQYPIGGKHDHRHGYPIDVVGRVRRIAEGTFRRLGPIDGGVTEEAGTSALIEAEGRHGGSVLLVIVSRPIPLDDSGLFLALGVPVEERRIVVVKSATSYRAAWAPGEWTVLPATTPGISTDDLAFFPFQRVPRPIWPLDPL